MKLKSIKDKQSEKVLITSRGTKVNQFRKDHKIGDKVTGLIIRYLDEQTALVQVGQIKMLAHLQIMAPENQELVFTVKQLHPYIILKESSPKEAGLNLYI